MPYVSGPISLLSGGKILPAGSVVEVSEEESKALAVKGFVVVKPESIQPELKSGGNNMLTEDEKGKIPENNPYEFSGLSDNSGTKVLSGGTSGSAPKMGASTAAKKSSTAKSTVKTSTVKKGE